MNNLANHPLAAFVNAMQTIFGRIILVAFAVVLGAFFGGATATHSFAGACNSVATLPWLAVYSVFIAPGIIALPAAFIFVILFVRYEWPLKTVAAVTVLIWWDTHYSILAGGFMMVLVGND